MTRENTSASSSTVPAADHASDEPQSAFECSGINTCHRCLYKIAASIVEESRLPPGRSNSALGLYQIRGLMSGWMGWKDIAKIQLEDDDSDWAKTEKISVQYLRWWVEHKKEDV